MFRSEIPKGYLYCLLKREAERPPVAAAQAVDLMDQRQRRLILQSGPGFGSEDADDLVVGRQRPEKTLHEAETDMPGIVDDLDGGDVGLIRPHLTVANDAVASELKAGNPKLNYVHINQPVPGFDISVYISNRSRGEICKW